MQLGKHIIHKITIEPTDNMGFIVRVGCGRFVFADETDLLNGLADYLESPEEHEKQYNDNSRLIIREVSRDEEVPQPTHNEPRMVPNSNSGILTSIGNSVNSSI